MSKVEAREKAPVVSSDPNSAESVLARSAKEIELQSKVDSQYDDVLERFQNPGVNITRETIVLSSIAVILGVTLLASIQKGRR